MIFKGKKSGKQNSYSCDEQEKFELVSCPLNGKYCSQIRSEMNRNYAESMDFLNNKEFNKSINALQNAYNKTMELPHSPCSVCADFYRATLTKSMEIIHDDLKNMSTGLFKTSRYLSSYEESQRVLTEFKDNEQQTKSLKNAV